MEYLMPKIPSITDGEVIMEDCPFCKDLDKKMKEMGLK